MANVVGGLMVAGLVVFLIGAAGWRLAYEQPLEQALPLVHADRRRRAWIHGWMIVAMPLTSSGIIGVALLWRDTDATVVAGIAGAVYLVGAVCWTASLTFRLTVVPWAASRTVADGSVPDGFVPLNEWAGMLYVVHMAAAYVASAALGVAAVMRPELPTWLGWSGVGFGAACLLGFTLTRAEGPLNPPFLAHLYPGVVGMLLLVG